MAADLSFFGLLLEAARMDRAASPKPATSAERRDGHQTERGFPCA